MMPKKTCNQTTKDQAINLVSPTRNVITIAVIKPKAIVPCTDLSGFMYSTPNKLNSFPIDESE